MIPAFRCTPFSPRLEVKSVWGLGATLRDLRGPYLRFLAITALFIQKDARRAPELAVINAAS